MRATSATGSTRGFTLVELMVVLTILALLAASLPVALNRFVPARRVVTAADRLIADVHRLQSEAAGPGVPTRLVVTELRGIQDARACCDECMESVLRYVRAG